ncbi:MAG: Fur family transcriptional regulator [bacterium]
MQISKGKIEQRMENFMDLCRNAGVKLTHQRMEIYREVAQTGDHPDAETVFQGVREQIPTVSLDTVYRTLWLLSNLNLINIMGPLRERTRFDANLSRHHHFVCIRCGLTRDFYSPELDVLQISKSVKSFGHVETAQIEVRGVCLACANNKTPIPEA